MANLGTIPSLVAQKAARDQLFQQQAAFEQQALNAQLQQALAQQKLQALPQEQAQQALSNQLALEIQRAQLEELRNPQLAVTRQIQKELALQSAKPGSGVVAAPTGLEDAIISTPGALSTEQQAALIAGGVAPTVAPGAPITPFSVGSTPTGFSLDPSKVVEKPFELGPNLVQLNRATGKYEAVYKGTPTSTTPRRIVNLTNPKDVRWLAPDASGLPPEGFQFSDQVDQPMKPSEKLSAQREIRTVYDDLPAKIDFFGKGQIAGSDQLKTRLDAVLKPVNGDFSKLNPQAKQTFVFAINKLRDPTSATLLSEATQIAARAGIGDRFSSFIESYKTGDPLPNQVAKDIYDVISQVHASHKENLINSLLPLQEDADSLNKKLTSFGVPKAIQDEVERRIASQVSSPVGTVGINPNAPSPITPTNYLKKWGL